MNKVRCKPNLHGPLEEMGGELMLRALSLSHKAERITE